jgi:hypothetical protein
MFDNLWEAHIAGMDNVVHDQQGVVFDMQFVSAAAIRPELMTNAILSSLPTVLRESRE